MKLNPERIIVNSHSALGDTMEYQPFFLMLRTMFPQAEIHCVCNQNTMLLAKLIPGRCDRYSPLWEECRGPNELNRDEFNRRFVDCVKHGFSDGKPADLIILMDRRTELIKLALSTDCPHVVTFSYFPALYTPRLHFLPWIPRKKIHEIFHYQHLLKCINPQRYQECFAQLDLDQARPHFNDQENTTCTVDCHLEANSHRYRAFCLFMALMITTKSLRVIAGTAQRAVLGGCLLKGGTRPYRSRKYRNLSTGHF